MLFRIILKSMSLLSIFKAIDKKTINLKYLLTLYAGMYTISLLSTERSSQTGTKRKLRQMLST
ncbi:hypothetical protein MJH12_04310, partial [bacterium]|nr:hypothetical protein [bacterium]